MKRILFILLAATLVLICAIPVLASDTSVATYEATVEISNNGTATTNVAVPFTLSTPGLVSAGYLDSDANYACMTDNDDVIFMPGWSTNPWVCMVDSIGANATLRYSLYTANESMGVTPIYFPGSTGMTVPHDATLAVSTNYSLSITGYINTAQADGILFYRYDSPGLDGCRLDIGSSAGEIDYWTRRGGDYENQLQATGISSGVHNIQIISNSSNVSLIVDGVTEDTTAFEGIVGSNSEDWQIGSAATLYINSANISIGGALQGSWDWEFGATFADDSPNSNTATPTFRTTSSDADVSAEITAFEPIDTATAPAYFISDESDFYTGALTASGNFSTNETSSGGPAVLGVVDDMSDAGGAPRAFLWGILGCVAFATTGLSMSYVRKRYGIGGGYVFTLLLIGILIFGLLIAFQKFDWWMLWFYIIIAGGMAMASRHIDWGGATSQHSLIGFLAMAWIGLTMINRIMEGSFITSAETSYLNTITFTRAFSLMELFTIPILNFSFFTEGIPALLRWDYSFFGGQAQIVQYMLYSITAVVSFIIFGIILGLVYSAITRNT